MKIFFRVASILLLTGFLAGCSEFWCWPFDCSSSQSSTGVDDSNSADSNSAGSTKTTPPSTTTPPAGGSSGGGDIDLSKVNWLHTNVSGWPVTSKLTVSINNGQICLSFADSTKWPPATIRHTSGTKNIQVNANPWVFVFKDGKWNAGTFEWFTVGNTCKSASKTVKGDHIKKDPLKTWKPKKGETLYFMASALARAPHLVNHKARTDIVKVVWPG